LNGEKLTLVNIINDWLMHIDDKGLTFMKVNWKTD